MQVIEKNAKALLLLAVIAVAAGAQALGVDVGLDVEHYIGLLLVDLGIWSVPNKDKPEHAISGPDGPMG